jgi:GNAT superfamily N-acetyltransferase
MHIRDFTPDDYPAITNIHNALYPARSRTPQGWAKADEHRDPKCKFRRWVAVEAGAVVGTGAYDQDIGDYAPHRFYVDFKVAPENQRRGIGAALYEHVMAELQPFEPHVLRANAFEDRPQGFVFMQRRGFFEAWRETPVRLDLAAVDLAPYAGLEERLDRDGIRILTLADLASDPARDRKLYDLYMIIDRTLPREEASEVQPMDFETWSRVVLNDEISLDGYFVAVLGDAYIGLKELGVDRSTHMLWAGLMGVLPEYRRRGIGMAMQARAIAYARAKGFPTLSSSTGAVNQAMQHIFTRLGYLRLPVWHQLQKDIQ